MQHALLASLAHRLWPSVAVSIEARLLRTGRRGAKGSRRVTAHEPSSAAWLTLGNDCNGRTMAGVAAAHG